MAYSAYLGSCLAHMTRAVISQGGLLVSAMAYFVWSVLKHLYSLNFGFPGDMVFCQAAWMPVTNQNDISSTTELKQLRLEYRVEVPKMVNYQRLPCPVGCFSLG